VRSASGSTREQTSSRQTTFQLTSVKAKGRSSQRHRLSHHLILTLAVTLLGGAIILLLAAGTAAPGFPEASNAELSRGGIILSNPPPFFVSSISQAQAEAIALDSAAPTGSQIRDSILAQFHFVANHSVDCLCWVVSVMPPGGRSVFSGPASSGPRPAWGVHYYLIFVDAESGQFVFAREVGAPPGQSG
jgi:hypothetical protein